MWLFDDLSAELAVINGLYHRSRHQPEGHAHQGIGVLEGGKAVKALDAF